MVIQRWQSVFLLIAGILTGIFSVCSLGQIHGATIDVDVTAMGLYELGEGGKLLHGTIYVAIVAWLTALLSFIAIFMYKNTRLQKKVCWLSIVLLLAACGSEWLAAGSLEVAGAAGISWGAVVFAPFVALICLLMAVRCIKSDEKKLSSYDRLR